MSSQNLRFLIPSPLPPLSSFLLSRVYLVNRLWGYPPPPYRDDIVYGRPPTTRGLHLPKIDDASPVFYQGASGTGITATIFEG